jgi:hypothetical protein
MTVEQLYMWHREQAERYEDLARNHRTTGASVVRNAVTRRNLKLAEFHTEAAAVLNEVRTKHG